jgi:pimeloyl-ACP methyl ester carboxylesterase
MKKGSVILCAALASAYLWSVANSDVAMAGDTAIADPEVDDPEYPPIMVPVTSFEVQGDRANGYWLHPAGAGPFPTVIFLHGFPGYEQNRDTAQALRRAGFVIFFFHYRGSWGSGGNFSFAGARQDVGAAVEYVKSFCGGKCKDAPLDSDRIALFGHSMGGWLALMAAADRHDLSCVMALDFWNAGQFSVMLRETLAETGKHHPFWQEQQEQEELFSSKGAPLRTAASGVLLDEIVAMSDDANPVNRAGDIAKVPLFLISTNNESHEDLVEALKEFDAPVRAEAWDTSHSFDNKRVALSSAAIDWFTNSCGFDR